LIKLKYYFYIVFALLIWSTYSLILKLIHINPVIFTFLTTISGWIFITAYVTRKKISLGVSFKTFMSLVLLTAFFLVNSITFFYAYQLTSISNAIFSHYLAPVFVALSAPFLLKEPVEKVTVFSLSLSVIGMLLIFFPKGFSHLSMSYQDILGIALGVVSAVCYALLIVLIKILLTKIDYYVVMSYQGFITFIIFLMLLPFLNTHIHFHFKYLPFILLIGFTHSFFAPIMYLEGIKRVKAQIAGLLGYSEVVGSIVIGIIFFNEIPLPLSFIGGFLIVFAGGMTIYYDKNRLNS